MVKVCVEVDCCEERPKPRIVPRLGSIKEQVGDPPTPSAEYTLARVKETLLMAFAMTVTQQVDVTIAITDKKGNPAAVDGVPEWATDNSDVVSLTPSPDGMTCTVVAVGMIGTANVQVSADADLGSGTTPVIGTLEVGVTAGTASVISLTPGTPTEQP